jgi:Putative adhesin
MSTAIATPVPAPTTAALRLALKLIAALSAAACIAAGTLTLLNVMARHTFTVRNSYAGASSLYIDSGAGDVRLTGAPGSRLTTVEHVTEDLATPRRVSTLTGLGLLKLSDHCSILMSTDCSVNYDIAVPFGVNVRASSGAGDIKATGLITTAPIRLYSGAGDLHAIAISAPTVHLNTGAGDITARLTTAPRDLQASSGAGDITITVPNVTYDLSASSGAGSVSDQDVRTDPNSPRRINVSAGAGDITIRVSR